MWMSFVRWEQKKTELIKFLVHRFGNHSSIVGKLQLFVACEEKCISTKADCVRQFPSLESKQEEADTRMLLRVKYISPSISKAIIHTTDTDVFVMHLQHQLNSQLTYSYQTGSKIQAQIISIEKVKKSLCLQYDVNDRELAAKFTLVTCFHRVRHHMCHLWQR